MSVDERYAEEYKSGCDGSQTSIFECRFQAVGGYAESHEKISRYRGYLKKYIKRKYVARYEHAVYTRKHEHK